MPKLTFLQKEFMTVGQTKKAEQITPTSGFNFIKHFYMQLFLKARSFREFVKRSSFLGLVVMLMVFAIGIKFSNKSGISARRTAEVQKKKKILEF